MESSNLQSSDITSANGDCRSKSAQHAKLIATCSAIKDSIDHHKPKIYVFSDSWAVCKGITECSGKWQQSGWLINGKPLWSQDYWIKLYGLSKQIKIYTRQRSCHRQNTHMLHNPTADALAKGVTPEDNITIVDKSKSLAINLKLVRNENND